jgi:hypothetical protein
VHDIRQTHEDILDLCLKNLHLLLLFLDLLRNALDLFENRRDVAVLFLELIHLLAELVALRTELVVCALETAPLLIFCEYLIYHEELLLILSLPEIIADKVRILPDELDIEHMTRRRLMAFKGYGGKAMARTTGLHYE